MSKINKKMDKSKEELYKLHDLIDSATKIKRDYNSILQIGFLHFKDSLSSFDEKPFMRVVHNVRIEDCVHQVLHKQWKVKQPRIVVLMISNVGPLKEWTNPLQIKRFQKGLMKAADNTNMWLITNGVNIGLSSLIGEAVRNEITEIKRSRNRNYSSDLSKLNFIGITDQQLLRYGESIANSKEYTIQIPNIGSTIGDDKYELNRNLTHYVVIKDDTLNKSGVNQFLTNFTNFLSKVEEPTNTSVNSVISEDSCSMSGVEIPVVSIIIQGGYESSRLVLQQIKNQIPVIVLGGSGGLANLLAFVEYEIRERCFEVWDPEYIESYIKPELTLKIVTRFPHLRDNALLCKTFRNRILDCVRESRKDGQIYLTVINMYNSYSCDLENLSEYLLLALFKSRSLDQVKSDVSSLTSGIFKPNPEIVSRDMYLCVDWNCPEVAKREVINKDPSFGHNLHKKMFEEALTRTNRCDFIDLFLTHGFKLRSFVSPLRLKRMYRKIHSHDFYRTVCWEGILGLSFDIKQSQKFIDRELNLLMNTCTGLRNFFDENELDFYVMGIFPRSPEEAERKALTIVVIWGLFHFRKSLVKVLWKHSDQPIYMALIIAMIYEKLSWYVTEEGLKEEIENESKLFISYAYNVLDICFKDSADRAEEALNETSKDWNYKSPVDIAANARHRTFLSHPCCQKWLTDTFNGNIKVREIQWGFIQLPVFVKIIVSAFFMFPMYFWIRFKGTKKREIYSSDENEVIDDDEETKCRNNTIEEEKTESRKTKNPGFSIPDHEIIIPNQPPPWVMAYELWNAPIAKFWISQLFYIIYLSLFSLAVLYPKCGNYYLDFVVCVWTSSITADLIRRTYTFHMKYTNLPISYKVLEIVIQILFIMIYGSERLLYHQTFGFITPYTLKVILCLNLLYAYYVLFTVYLPISATLGPLLYRLKIMILVDFLNFIRMIVLAMVSFGIVMQTLLYPDQELNSELFRLTFHRTFFTLFLTPVDELIEEKSCDQFVRNDTDLCLLSRYTQYRCPNTGFWPYLISISYLILLKLIFVTLLYAIFANSASKASDTDNIWKFQRYLLVMDFVNRLPLPPPLNIIYYSFLAIRWIAYMLICYIPHKTTTTRIGTVIFTDDSDPKNQTKLLSEEDYSYFKSIAADYYEEQENKINNETLIKQQWERLQANSEEIEFQKKILKQLKGKMSDTERAVRQSLVYLESIKHLTSRKYGKEFEIKNSKLHIISRHSPYPRTSVQRYPVPDKYVSWDVMFIAYDPVTYTKPVKEFHISLQQFADEDILLLIQQQIEVSDKKLPVFEWNRSSTNAAGITIDRQSWQMSDNQIRIVYKLDNGIPRNPFGRTGLRGRGSLLRWGPNHYIMIVITRMISSNILQVLIEIDKNDLSLEPISLLNRFIPGELTYIEIEKLFITETHQKGWTHSEKMIQFFKSCDKSDEIPPETANDTIVSQTGLKYERIRTGYCDASLNTDQAWKEVELWHFHYTQKDLLKDKIKQNIEWREVNEDLFAKLVLTQSHVLQDIVDKFHVILHT